MRTGEIMNNTLSISFSSMVGVGIFAAVLSMTPSAEAKSFHEISTGCATSIGAGDGNYPWITGCTKTGNDYHVYYWGGSSLGWQETNGTGVKISVVVDSNDGNNYPAVVNASNEVYVATLLSGSDTPGASTPITVTWDELTGVESCGTSYFDWSSGSGTLFAVGCTNSGDNAVYSGTVLGGWTAFSTGSGASIAGYNREDVWLTNVAGNVYHNDGSGWTERLSGDDANNPTYYDGSATAYVVAGVSTTYLKEWNGSGWTNVTICVAGTPCPAFSTTLPQVSVGQNGTVWFVSSGTVWYYN
jgi:hypothetical protein